MENFNQNDSFDDFILSQTNFPELQELENYGIFDNNDINFDLEFNVRDGNTDTNEANTSAANVEQMSDDKENLQRFPDLVTDDLDNIAQKCSEKSTMYQTKWALKLLRGKLFSIQIVLLYEFEYWYDFTTY